MLNTPSSSCTLVRILSEQRWLCVDQKCIKLKLCTRLLFSNLWGQEEKVAFNNGTLQMTYRNEELAD